MKRRRRQSADRYLLYNDVTEPMLSNFTTPIPRIELPRESGVQRIVRGLGTFFSAIINKVNQLLALALAVLLLLLFTRFILTYFNFTSTGGPLSFSHWVFLLSTPLVVPFQNMLPALHFNGYVIDVSLLIAILVYAI
ncbi:MAG TPA: YggT family protein, partial [Ktedonobacteraceae bacterium]